MCVTACYFLDKENYIPLTMIFSVLTLIFGLISFYIKRKKTNLKNNRIENLVLKIATPHNGLITTAELAANSSLGLKEASVFLKNCYSKGLCEKQYTEKGLVEVYYFKSAITLESKKTSKLITEIEI